MKITPATVRPDIVHEDNLVEVLSYIHPIALGLAVAIVAGGTLFVMTAFHILVKPEIFPLRLLREYFPGYQQTWVGALIGAGWMSLSAFFAGALIGVVHKLTTRFWLFVTNSRAELTRRRDVFDQIR